MIRACFFSLLSLSFLYANNWVMFHDGKDTYIYNQKSGEIYVRFRKGGANYEDIFVKMPQGINPSKGVTSNITPDSPTESERKEILQKALELQNRLSTQAYEP